MSVSAEMQKDFDALAEFTGTAAIFYSDIHNENVESSNTGYDYTTLVYRVSKARGWTEAQTIDELERIGVLKYQTDGNFVINLAESTKRGGGANHNNGTVLFCYDEQNPSVIYHEYAHSLQNIHNTISGSAVSKLYSDVGLHISKEQEKNADEIQDYFRYLNEIHADIFAYSAMLLRAKDTKEFIKFAVDALDRGTHTTIKGFFSKEMEYGKTLKHYASFNAMKKMIWDIAKLKKQNKTQDFFDENGVLKFNDLSVFAKNIVLDKVYSPIQFKAFKHQNIEISSTKRGVIPIDHNYIQDLMKSLLTSMPISMAADIMDKTPRSHMRNSWLEHQKVIEQNIKNQKRIFEGFIDYSASKPLVALQSIEKIHAGISMVDQYFNMQDGFDDCLRAYIAKRFKQNSMVYDSSKECRKILGLTGISDDKKNVDYMTDFIMKVDRILVENRDNEYFKKIMSYSDVSFYNQRQAIDALRYNPEDLQYYQSQPVWTPLMSTQDKDMVKSLIDIGINVNAVNEYGETALIRAKNFDVAYEIANAGADVNKVDNNSKSALMHYVSAETIEPKEIADMTTLLLRKGANVNLVDCYGKDALTYLMENKHISDKHKKAFFGPFINCGADTKVAMKHLTGENKELLEAFIISTGANAQKYAKAREKLQAKSINNQDGSLNRFTDKMSRLKTALDGFKRKLQNHDR